MALKARVIARIPERRLRELTNEDRDAEGINEDRLSQACTDAESAFEERCGALYDDTKPGDQRVATDLVVAYLSSWASGDDGYLEKAFARAERYAQIRGRNRSPGATTSELTRDTEVESGEEIAPWSDSSSWDGYSPKAP